MVPELNYGLLGTLTRSTVGLPTAAGARLWVKNLTPEKEQHLTNSNFRTLESETARL
jgi:hypothetical protein